jgi:hypothetical protein
MLFSTGRRGIEKRAGVSPRPSSIVYRARGRAPLRTSLVWPRIALASASHMDRWGLSPTCVSQASAAESRALPPAVRSAFMTGLIPLALSINAETLLAQAQAARVAAHIRMVLARLKSRA